MVRVDKARTKRSGWPRFFEPGIGRSLGEGQSVRLAVRSHTKALQMGCILGALVSHLSHKRDLRMDEDPIKMGCGACF